MPDAVPILEMKHVSKRYGGIAALNEVDFVAYPGEIHAILGENGAGKSTLIKIAAGVTDPSDGEVFVEGRRVNFRNPTEAMAAGVVCVFQELSLLPDLTVADNLSIVSPPLRGGLINSGAQRQRARELLASIGCEDVHPLELVRDLPLSRRQMVEIAKALAKKPKLLILDEATSALTAADVERVYAIIRKLRSEGIGILYVSHRMHEIEALADCATVFRNGRRIETFQKGERSVSAIVQMMIGRELTHHYPDKPAPKPAEPVALSAKNLSWGTAIARHLTRHSQGRNCRTGRFGWSGAAFLAAGAFRCAQRCFRRGRNNGQTAPSFGTPFGDAGFPAIRAHSRRS